MGLFKTKPDVEAVHLLADHLEAVLGIADEMRTLSFTAQALSADASSEQILDDLARLSAFVERLKSLELAIASKLNHARKSAERLARADSRLKPFADLFHSGTTALVEAVPRLADVRDAVFHHGNEPIVFLKRRGMIPADINTLESIASLKPDNTYFLLSAVPLGALVELTESSLQALDTHYGIYVQEGEDTAAPAAPAAQPAPQPTRLTDRLKRIMQG